MMVVAGRHGEILAAEASVGAGDHRTARLRMGANTHLMSNATVRQQHSILSPRRLPRLMLVLFGAGVLLWAAWAWWADRSYRGALMAIELEMANGRLGIASRELHKLLEQSPHDEAAILLGRCEQERGRLKAAGEALARVSAGVRAAHKATLARMRLFHDQGQFAAAEQLIIEVANDPRSDAHHTRVLLVPIYSQLGRVDEAKRLLEEWWYALNERGEGASERAIDQVRMHIELDFKPNSLVMVRDYLAGAYARAPDDDRVWLGRANLAIRAGDFSEARRWLDECLKRRPDDEAVWSAWLRLGIASSQVKLVDQALTHLPADALDQVQIHRLGAWFCARRGDGQSERQELERVFAADSTDLQSLDRLVGLTEAAGQTGRVRELTDRKSEIEAIRARYEQLFDRNQPIRDAEEMAQIAERLGRTFEARAFLTVEIPQDPSRFDLRKDLERLAHTTATTPRRRTEPGRSDGSRSSSVTKRSTRNPPIDYARRRRRTCMTDGGPKVTFGGNARRHGSA